MENPSTPLSDPDDWLVNAWGGGASSSGVKVNVESALTYSPVWRAVCLISLTVAKLPLVVYRRAGEGKEKDAAHPAYQILRYKPNAEMTAYQFRIAVQAPALLRGNGYAFIVRNGAGAPVELIPLDPAVTYPSRSNGVLYYVTKIQGQDYRVDPSLVFHIRGLGDGIEGRSVVQKARESFGLGMAAEKYGGVFFRNSARPSAVLEHPGHLGKEAADRLRASWEAVHTDLENKHRIAILEEGMKINPFGMSNEDAQFLETRELQIREVANWFGLPPHKLGDTKRTSFASLEEENQSYLDDGIDPWLCNWESECWDKLLSEEEKAQDTRVIEFMRQALARANMAARGAFYNLALQTGWMNRDEVRARENLNPIPDGAGETFLVPMNMSPAPLPGAAAPPDQGQTDPAVQDPGAAASAGRALLADLLSRVVRRLTLTARRRAKDGDAFMDWLEGELEAEHRPVSMEAAIPVLEVLRAGRLLDPAPTAEELLEAVFGQVREALLGAAEVGPKDLGASVKAVCERLEATLPARLAEKLTERGHGKTDAP